MCSQCRSSGYQPTNKLDTSKPPPGRSIVPSHVHVQKEIQTILLSGHNINDDNYQTICHIENNITLYFTFPKKLKNNEKETCRRILSYFLDNLDKNIESMGEINNV